MHEPQVEKPTGVSSEGSWSSTAPVEGQLEYVEKAAGCSRSAAQLAQAWCADPRSVHALSAKTVSDFLVVRLSAEHG